MHLSVCGDVMYRETCGRQVYIHIGVGSDVVCSILMGNARASICGTDNRTVPRFFMSGICIYGYGT